MTIMDIMECLPSIDADKPVSIEQLKQKLRVIAALGYSEDGGFPVLSEGDVLEGYIATSELSHGLDLLEAALKRRMTEEEIAQVSCYIRKQPSENYMITTLNQGLKTPIRNLLTVTKDHDSINEDMLATKQALNDFSLYVDHVIHQSTLYFYHSHSFFYIIIRLR